MTKIAILLLLISLSLSSTISSALNDDNPTAYEMLEKFNFPKGILPTGVTSYKLNSNGEFEVLFKSECEFKVEGGYLLKYKKRLTGKVEMGSLKQLNGVSVRVLYMWFGINEVTRNNENLYFYVGPLSATFSVSNFKECPQCRCGYDCNSVPVPARGVDRTGGKVEVM